MAVHDDIHFVRIGGLVDGSGNVYTFTTDTPPAAWLAANTHGGNLLMDTVQVAPTSIEFLGTLVASPTLSVTFNYDGDKLARLIASSGAAVLDANGAPVRIIRYAKSTDTALTCTDDTNVSTSTVYYVGAEAVNVTAKPGSDVLTVQRARHGTLARPISVPTIGPVLRTGPATMKGMPVTAGIITSAGTEVVRFLGFVDSTGLRADADTMVCTVGVRSIVQHLRDAKYRPPVSRTVPRWTVRGQGGSGPPSAVIEVDVDEYGPDGTSDSAVRWTHARWCNGDKWVIKPINWLGGSTDAEGFRINTYDAGFADTNAVDDIVAAGEGKAIYHFTTTQPLDDRLVALSGNLIEFARDVLENADRVEHAIVDTSTTWAASLYDLLTRETPYGSGLALPTAYIDGLQTALNDVENTAGLGRVIVNTLHSTYGYAMPWWNDVDWSEVLRDWLRVTFTGLTFSASGTLGAIDWLRSTVFDEFVAIAESDLVGGAEFEWSDRQVDARNLYRLDFRYRSSFLTQNAFGRSLDIVDTYDPTIASSEVTGADLAQAESVEVPGHLCAQPEWREAVINRVKLAIAAFSATAPEVQFTTQPIDGVDVGKGVTITRRDFPQTDGSIGTQAVKGLVTAVGIDDGRNLSLTVALTGWAEGDPDAGTRSPCGQITAWSSPWATISANAFTSSTGSPSSDSRAFDLLDWGGGETMAGVLLDTTGVVVGTATISDVDTSGSRVRLDSPSITPTTSHIIALDDWDNQSAELQAKQFERGVGGQVCFGADPGGTLGAGGDAPFEWDA